MELVRVLVLADKKSEAVAQIAKAAKAIPKELAPLALGRCYESLGDADNADKAQVQYLAAPRPGPTMPSSCG